MAARTALVLSAALAAVVGVVGASPARPAAAVVTLDVIAWPGEAAGPLQWKLWRVNAGEPMRTVALGLPAGAIRPAALEALAAQPQPAGGRQVGRVTATVRRATGGSVTASARLAVGGCPGARPGSLATLRFESSGGCSTVVLDGGPGRETLELAVLPAMPIVALGLRLDSLQTAAGRLLPANPERPAVTDTSAAAVTDSGTIGDAVREVSGGATEIAVAPARPLVSYGRTITVAGTVRRGGSPAAGELVALHAVHGSVADVPARPSAVAVTNAEGRFSAPIRPTSTSRLGAWAAATPDGARPRLNTLAGITAGEVVVRAPRPPVRKRHVRRLPGGRARATIVVRNPLALFERLRCRLYVGRRQVAERRFPRRPARLVFRVTARRHAKVRAVVGRWVEPRIAGRSSRTIRLLPRPARRRG